MQLAAENSRLTRNNRLLSEVISFTEDEITSQIAVLGMAAGKFGGALNETQLEAVARIKQSVVTMQRMVTHYLTLVRMDNPAFTPSIVLIDPVKDLIEPLLFLYADFLSEKGQTCNIKPAMQGMLIWGDPDLLASVFECLLTSAIKHGRQDGKIIIEIEDRGTESEITMLCASPALSPDQVDSLFDPTTHHRSHGMALVKQIIEAHRGRVWAESQQGEWTRITFTLPCRRRSNSNSAKEQKTNG